MNQQSAPRATIICTETSGRTKYVFNAALRQNNVRVPSFTDDPAKARLYYPDEATDLIPKLPNTRKYFTEIFQPAAVNA